MGMGVGGGGLLVIYFTLYLNISQPIAQGCNLFLFVFAGAFSLLYHFRKRSISKKYVLTMILFGLPSSFFTSSIANNIDPKYPRIALGILLIVSGLLTLYNILKIR